jgi:hypothetical protein
LEFAGTDKNVGGEIERDREREREEREETGTRTEEGKEEGWPPPRLTD